MPSMTSTRKVAVPVAGSRVWTKGSSGEMVRCSPGSSVKGGRWNAEGGTEVERAIISPHVTVEARPSSRPDSVCSSSVDAADDAGDDGLRGVEDAALDFELLVVGTEEVLVEVDDGILAAGLVVEVGEDDLHVGVRAGEEVGEVAHAELVEVDGAPAAPEAEEDAKHFPQKRAGEDEVRHVVLGDGGAFAGEGAADGDGKEA